MALLPFPQQARGGRPYLHPKTLVGQMKTAREFLGENLNRRAISNHRVDLLDLPIANGGTGQTTANAAFNALVPSQSSQSGKFLTTDGTNTSWATASTTISNDTSTSSFLYPLFSAATSGTITTAYTSNAKLLYKPSTGELESSVLVADNGIMVNSSTISTSYTIASGQNGLSAGNVTIASGVTVTVSSNQRWVVV